jgi:hypothetical protein
MALTKTRDVRFIPVSEAADRLGLSVNTIKRRVDAGILRGYRDPINGYYSVAEPSVEDLLQLRQALQRSAALPGAEAPRKEWTKRPVTSRR